MLSPIVLSHRETRHSSAVVLGLVLSRMDAVYFCTVSIAQIISSVVMRPESSPSVVSS